MQSTFEFLVLGSYYRDMLRHLCRFGFLSVWSAAWPHVVTVGHGRYAANVCWVCIRGRPLGVNCPAADLDVSPTALCHRVWGKEWIFRITEVKKQTREQSGGFFKQILIGKPKAARPLGGSWCRKYIWEKQMQLAQVTVQTWQFVVIVTNLRASCGTQYLDDLWRHRDFQEVPCVSWCVVRSLAVCLHLTRQGHLETCFREIPYFVSSYSPCCEQDKSPSEHFVGYLFYVLPQVAGSWNENGRNMQPPADYLLEYTGIEWVT